MERPRKPPILPFAILAGVLGVLAGFSLALLINPEAARVRESPFAPEGTENIPEGRDFNMARDIKSLPAGAKESYRKSLDLAASGSGPLAIRELSSLRKDHPGFCPGHALAAQVHIGLMDASQADSVFAYEALRACLEKDPDHPWANYLAGRFWEQAHRPDSALAHYLLAVKTSPRFAYPYVGLGRIHLESGDSRSAKANLRTAIGLMESDKEAYASGSDGAPPETEAMPYDLLAAQFFRDGAEDSASMAFEYGEQLGLKTDRMSLVQGWLWESRGFLGKADSVYSVLRAKDSANPEYVHASVTLGWKPRSRSGNGPAPADAEAIFAISLLDPLAREHNRNAPLWMALGEAYYRRGLYGMATECFDSSLKYDAGLADLAEKREAAYQALARQRVHPGSGRAARPSGLSPEEQTPVVIPGSIALLGAYSVSWGSTQAQIRRAYPNKTFATLPNGNMTDTFLQDGVRHDYLLAFKAGRLWGVRVVVSDSAGVSGDLFGRTIRTKAKISGEGKGTGEAKCTGYRSFQGAIWESDDTFEFMAQFEGETRKVRLARIDRAALPRERRLCDVVNYLREDPWK